MKKNGFEDRSATPKTKKIKTPIDFTSMPYDQRSGCYFNAGSDYGVGTAQPFGTKGSAKQTNKVVPQGVIDTMITTRINKGAPTKMVDINER